MSQLNKYFVGLMAPLALMAFGARPGFSADASKSSCESLSALKLADTTFKATYVTTKEELAAILAFGGDRPPSDAQMLSRAAALPFCRVEATITPAPAAEIKSEVWLPAADKWNKNFTSQGAGGAAGTIGRTGLADGASHGYAASASDAGSHTDALLSMSFGRNPEWRANFAYRGVHLTAVAAKALIQSYYGSKPKAAVFYGCSGGGYEAMSLIQRYPDDYNGVLVGDPALHWEKIGLWQGSAYVATHRDPAAQIPESKLPIIYKAAMAKCDALDGVTDGVIDDPRRCKVDFTALQCKNGNGADCFTPPQVAALTKIYAPLHHPRTNEFLFPGFNFGAESASAARSRISGAPDGGSTITPVQPGPLVWSFPETFAAKDWLTFDFDKGTDDAVKAFAPYANSDPDITKFKQAGGKVIMYSGWADPNLHPETLVDYYQKMTKIVGGDAAAQSFSRLFMVPGMNHCSGGPGPNVFGQDLADPFYAKTDASNNMLKALERWVVDGKAPEEIVATKFADNDRTKGVVERTRPLCVYPKVARWNTKGTTDDAKNFTCVAPQL